MTYSFIVAAADEACTMSYCWLQEVNMLQDSFTVSGIDVAKVEKKQLVARPPAELVDVFIQAADTTSWDLDFFPLVNDAFYLSTPFEMDQAAAEHFLQELKSIAVRPQ